MPPGLPALIASLVAPLLGPITSRLSPRFPAIPTILDGFMLVTIGGLILLDVLPHSYSSAGPIVIVLAALGLFGPTLLETLRHRIARHVHRAALVLGMVGLLLHSFIDGAGLVGSPSLSLALVLHRLPVGLAVWTLLRRDFGRRTAIIGLVLLNGVTVAGFGVANVTVAHMEAQWVSAFTALVGGSLLHVVVHLHTRGTTVRRPEAFETLGAGLGIVLLAFTLGGHDHSLGHRSSDPTTPGVAHEHAGHEHHGQGHAAHAHAHDHDGDWLTAFGQRFWALAEESALALLFAYLAAGLIFGFLPKGSIRWLAGKKSRFSQSARGVLFGLPLPICSCGVVPIYESLVRRGVPLAAALAFLIATPELGIDAAFLSWRLTGPEFTWVRLGAAALLAFGVSVLLARPGLARPAVDPDDAEHGPVSIGERLRASRAGLAEIVDHTAPWILFGLALAAIAEPLIDPRALAGWSEAWQVPAFALIGLPIYVCASGATPLAAVLLAQQVAPGAVLAFLLTGPATNVTTFGILQRLHGTRFAILFGVTVAGCATLVGFVANALLAETQFRLPEPTPHGAASTIPVVLISLLFLASLLRLGPRGYVRQILTQTSGTREAEPSSCGPCC